MNQAAAGAGTPSGVHRARQTASRPDAIVYVVAAFVALVAIIGIFASLSHAPRLVAGPAERWMQNAVAAVDPRLPAR